jgi:ribokinase
MPKPIMIMGIFAADLAFTVTTLPTWGETVLGSEFVLGPGGKGSNQAVAAARLDGNIFFMTKVGSDMFGEIARRTHREAGVSTKYILEAEGHSTGAAAIMVDTNAGDNAIVVTPGAANMLTCAEIDGAKDQIAASACFMTQLELSLDLVEHGLRVARSVGVPTILNPAPACDLSDEFLALCDYATPNEVEAKYLTGIPISTLKEAERAADALLGRGVKNVILTLGARGAFVKNAEISQHVPAFQIGPVVESTGAGDAFNGGLAVGLSEGMDLLEATRFGCATAGISVTRRGTAPSMPRRYEVDAVICGTSGTLQNQPR